jgi:hypothetical protein
MSAKISLSSPLHVELFYHVLSHLDLGRDAASLYNPDLPPRTWSAPLLEAYCNAPERLQAQVLPLLTPDLVTLQQRLRSLGFAGLQDEPGRLLCERLDLALMAELQTVEQRREGTDHQVRAEHGRQVMGWMEPLLQRLGRALYEESGMDAPSLLIVDCDALTSSRGTHGRCVSGRDRLIVAVSLAAPREQALCQILHEQTHQVTDGAIRRQLSHLQQDTRLDSGGFELHRQLEIAAVERGQQLIAEHAPDLLDAWQEWRRRHRI